MSDRDVIVGIDLGTTNSEVSALVDGRPCILGPGERRMLPSCVGLSPSGELLVGESARNQSVVYPELTVRSVKRSMGSDEKFRLGEKTFTPAEISSLILRELAEWAARRLDRPVTKAVITVPAYFSDAQRQATREAGALAGLEVVRILNEPTAASLAYGLDDETSQTVLVYDLGGGTFDVSIVTIEGDVTEVLASHGNNYLGGDDFDQLLLDRLVDEFRKLRDVDLKDCHPSGYSRLRWAAEEAKKRLSFEPYAAVREDALATVDGQGLHLDVELSRDDYEEMIRPLVESTLESVSQALSDAGKAAGDIDAVLLVGGSTRTPLVRDMLEERVGIPPRTDIHPDLCVALGAGLLASRLAGHDVRRVLVDISPYSFGPSFLGQRDGMPYMHCYKPIIRRNTPLPITRTEPYVTARPFQEGVDIVIYQGDDPDAMKNLLIGEFHVEGLTPIADLNEVLCRMDLDLDGILKVTAIEKMTGKSKYITISNALQPKTELELAAARERMSDLYAGRADGLDELDFAGAFAGQDETEFIDVQPQPGGEDDVTQLVREAEDLLIRSRARLGEVHEEDKEEMIDLHEKIDEAVKAGNADAIADACNELKELLFFIEGR